MESWMWKARFHGGLEKFFPWQKCRKERMKRIVEHLNCTSWSSKPLSCVLLMTCSLSKTTFLGCHKTLSTVISLASSTNASCAYGAGKVRRGEHRALSNHIEKLSTLMKYKSHKIMGSGRRFMYTELCRCSPYIDFPFHKSWFRLVC